MGNNWHESKMRKHLFILSTLVLFALCSCNKFAGDPITKDFSMDGSYTELQVENAFDVTVSDVATAITVNAGENVMPNVVVEKVGNKLRIHLKPMASSYGSEMKVTLPYNANLTSVDLSGASEFHSEYGLEGKKIEVDLSGASEFYCDLHAGEVELDLSGASEFFGKVEADEIDMDLSGASDATLEGQVAKLEINLTGGSNIMKKVVESRYALICDRCEGTMSGASEAYIHCDGSIKVNLSGSSELHYTGNASTSGSDCSGGSEVSHDVL